MPELPQLRTTPRSQALFLAVVALAASLVVLASPLHPFPALSGADGASRVVEEYGKLPISFEPNVGQAPNRFDFVARGQGFGMAINATGATLALGTKKSQELVRMNILGASHSATLHGLESLPGKVNYFIGDDPSKWRSDVSTFGRVSYSNVLPGIDVTYHGTNDGTLEYDFVVAPGADPGDIRIGFSGAEDVALRNGSLVITTATGAVTQDAPVLYQTIEGRQVPVSGRFLLSGDKVGFEVGTYDHGHALVIDPTLVYSTYLGGSASEASQEIAVDASGAAYVVGDATTEFPTTSGAVDTTFNGASDVFVTKLNATGSALIFSTYIGGSSTDQGFGIDVDATGATYVTGSTFSSDFPTTLGALDTSFNGGNNDVFVTKLDPDGSSLSYSTFLGGSGDESAPSIAVDATGAVYVTGSSNTSGFPTTSEAVDTTFQGNTEAFVTKLDPSGAALVYSTYLGGSDFETGSAVAVDRTTGEAYVTGATISSDFPTTSGAFDTSFNGNNDAFVTKLNASGSMLSYSTYLGGAGGDEGEGIDVDGTGAAYVIGATPSADFPTTLGALDASYNDGGADAFVTKLGSTGAALTYSTYLGGSGYEWGYDIDVETSGAVYVIGTIYSDTTSDFPTTSGALDTSFNGGSADAFFTELSASGSGLLHSTFFGGTDWDEGFGIAVDSSGAVYVTGNTYSSDFPTTPEAFDITWNLDYDVFVAKISPSSPSPSPSPTQSPSATPSPTPSASPSATSSASPSPSPSATPSVSPSPSPSPTPDPATCGGETVTIQVAAPDQITYGTLEVDVIVGTAGDDVIYGLDLADLMCGLGGNDKLYGGGGNDGGKYGDKLYGGAGKDRLAGDGGNDTLVGGSGNDRIFGNVGNDALLGNGGNDRLIGNQGRDTCNGGPGRKDSAKSCERTKNVPRPLL